MPLTPLPLSRCCALIRLTFINTLSSHLRSRGALGERGEECAREPLAGEILCGLSVSPAVSSRSRNLAAPMAWRPSRTHLLVVTAALLAVSVGAMPPAGPAAEDTRTPGDIIALVEDHVTLAAHQLPQCQSSNMTFMSKVGTVMSV